MGEGGEGTLPSVKQTRRSAGRHARRVAQGLTDVLAGRDYRCPLSGREGEVLRLEWLQVERHGVQVGEIPRACAEALGVSCGPLDERDEHGRQGTVWYRSDVSERMRRHRHWAPAEESMTQQRTASSRRGS